MSANEFHLLKTLSRNRLDPVHGRNILVAYTNRICKRFKLVRSSKFPDNIDSNVPSPHLCIGKIFDRQSLIVASNKLDSVAGAFFDRKTLQVSSTTLDLTRCEQYVNNVENISTVNDRCIVVTDRGDIMLGIFKDSIFYYAQMTKIVRYDEGSSKCSLSISRYLELIRHTFI